MVHCPVLVVLHELGSVRILVQLAVNLIHEGQLMVALHALLPSDSTGHDLVAEAVHSEQL